MITFRYESEHVNEHASELAVSDVSASDVISGDFPFAFRDGAELFVCCQSSEVPVLQLAFGFDESTVRDCVDLDESVRYSSYDGYDFISLVHVGIMDNDFILREINLYASHRYLVLVLPEDDGGRLAVMRQKLLSYARTLGSRADRLNMMYYAIFNSLLSDFSDMLEALEDRMQLLSGEIITGVSREQFAKINTVRHVTYTIKKHLRALFYLGDHLLLDENRLIEKKHTHYFHNVSTRFKKLYDFAESLYQLSGEMMSAYDSRLTMKTGDTVNKLTVVTLFFGPLTVITGIYGMNFNHMPELDLPFGYPLALIAMALISLVLFIVMKVKKWL